MGERTNVSTSQWEENWQKDFIPFHLQDVNPNLLKQKDLLSIDVAQRTVIFIPLCGKSWDIKWFYDLGPLVHVVGVEISDVACKAFFDEQNIKYTCETTADSTIRQYKSSDGRIVLYAADLFKLSRAEIGGIDIIWDRGSLIAINREDRERYAALMLSLLNQQQQSKYLLEVFDYDQTVFGGPPHSVDSKLLSQLYGDACDIQLVDETVVKMAMFESWGFPDGVTQKVYMLTPRQTRQT